MGNGGHKARKAGQVWEAVGAGGRPVLASWRKSRETMGKEGDALELQPVPRREICFFARQQQSRFSGSAGSDPPEGNTGIVGFIITSEA